MFFFVPKMKFRKKLNHFLLQNHDFIEFLSLSFKICKFQNFSLINKTFIINEYILKCQILIE